MLTGMPEAFCATVNFDTKISGISNAWAEEKSVTVVMMIEAALKHVMTAP
jgi:hypothetical protein